MAAGKPVVSTAVSDVIRNFTPVVGAAHSHGDFIRAVQRAHAAPDAGLIHRWIARAGQATWEVIVNSMRTHLPDSLKTA